MKSRICLQGTLVVVLCLIWLSFPALGIDVTLQLSLIPAPIARGETLTLNVLLDNGGGHPLENTTLYVPLPLGIDQWTAEVRIDGGAWVAYPGNGLIALDPIPPLGQMTIDIQVAVEQGAQATLIMAVQLLDATGILAEAAGWVNVLPSVDAGADLIADLGASITLSDSSASDGGGAIVGYHWTDHGAGGTFDDFQSLSPTYTPPAVSGVIELSLTVTDVDGGESSDSVRVRVNAAPSVEIGGDIETDEGSSLSMGQTTMSDADGWIADIAWSDGGAGGTFLPSNDVIDPLYVVPEIEGCEDGLIMLTIVVTDDCGATGTDTVNVTVTNGNELPVVYAPDDREVEAGQRVELSAIAVDSDGWIADIVWTDGGAGGAFLPSNKVIDPMYLVPEIEGCEDGLIVLTIIVTDDCGATGTDTVNVTVTNGNELPVVYAPDDREVEAGQRVELSAIAVDSDGWIAAQGWEQIDGIDVDLVIGSQEQHVWFDAPDVGAPTELLFRFWAIDNCGAEVWDDVLVTISPKGGSVGNPIGDGSLVVNLDVFDDRGLPMSPFDSPRDGDFITIRVSVTNTGSSIIENLTVTLDDGSTIGLLSDVLDPWDSTTGTLDWLVRSSSLVGGLEIVATVIGTDEAGSTITASDAFQFLGEQSSNNPALVLEKTASISEATEDEVIVYGYRMTNTSLNDLVGLTLYDDQLGWIDLPTTSLRAGEAIEAQVSYTVRESDLPGPLVNRAIATGFTSQGNKKVEAEASAHVDLLDIAGGGGGTSSQQQSRVVISEIAWAGSVSNPADEWIELANIGTAPVDLTGWRLSWYEKTGTVPPSSQWHSIELSGVIRPLTEACWRTTALEFSSVEDGLWSVHDPRWSASEIAAGFFIIERVHDSVIANVSANLVYGEAGNPYFELPDAGAVLFLIDADGNFVDSANAQYADKTGWPAGNILTCATMERINLSQGDFDGNWQTMSGVLTYGSDKSGRGLLATAGMPNSLALETLLQDAAASVDAVLVTGKVSVPIPELAASDRPTIQITALAGSIAAGGGGTVGSPELSTIRSRDGLMVEVDLENASSGAYFVWITLKNGNTLLLPLLR